MSTKRAERVGPLICEEIATVLSRKLDDPRLKGVTITQVRMTPDLKVARVFYSRIGDDEQIKAAGEGLARAAGVFRRALRDNLDLRSIPELEFHYDKNIAYADHIEQVLHEIHRREQDPEGKDQP
jgi:ribosome-binding factor A